jgi:DNA-binding Lrp family transcriptional regulator
VTPALTEFQKRLCNALQRGLPVDPQPFARLAESLGSTESQVLQESRSLKDAGIIRRFSLVLNHRALGRASTLVTAHVPEATLDEVVRAVNGLSGVSHNYLRDHHYNLWFTLQAESPEQVSRILTDLGRAHGVVFQSLSVTRVFKLDVRFDLECDDDVLTHEEYDVPGSEPVALTAAHKQVIEQLQGKLEITSRPFDILQAADRNETEVMSLLGELHALGVIRRIAAVMDQRRLGYAVNVMFAAEVSPEHVAGAGRRLARFRTVSHCYERETFPGWPYNLFAMMHARTDAQIQRVVGTFVAEPGVCAHALLATKAELKKQPVRQHFV